MAYCIKYISIFPLLLYSELNWPHFDDLQVTHHCTLLLVGDIWRL